MIDAAGGFGLNTLFLKFSRTDEEQADVVGAQTLARAGYDPMDMVTFFETLRTQQDGDPGKVEQFFSDHPAPKDRAARITKEMKMLTIRPTQSVGNLQKTKSSLKRMPPAPSMQQITQGQPGTTPTPASGKNGIERPSSQFQVFKQRDQFFQIEYPSNWRPYEPAYGQGVTLAPEGGFVDAGGKERDLICGVIVNRYDPFGGDLSDRFGDRSGSNSSWAAASPVGM